VYLVNTTSASAVAGAAARKSSRLRSPPRIDRPPGSFLPRLGVFAPEKLRENEKVSRIHFITFALFSIFLVLLFLSLSFFFLNPRR
jgi:hypothetical protein